MTCNLSNLLTNVIINEFKCGTSYISSFFDLFIWIIKQIVAWIYLFQLVFLLLLLLLWINKNLLNFVSFPRSVDSLVCVESFFGNFATSSRKFCLILNFTLELLVFPFEFSLVHKSSTTIHFDRVKIFKVGKVCAKDTHKCVYPFVPVLVHQMFSIGIDCVSFWPNRRSFGISNVLYGRNIVSSFFSVV